jgi:hypothetical protein
MAPSHPDVGQAIKLIIVCLLHSLLNKNQELIVANWVSFLKIERAFMVMSRFSSQWQWMNIAGCNGVLRGCAD